MEFRPLPVFAFLALALVVSHAALPSEDYWKSLLSYTVMPKAILDLLHPDFTEEKGTSVGVGKGGVNVNTNKPDKSGTAVNVGGTGIDVGHKGVGASTEKPGRKTKVGVKPGPNFFNYEYAATENQLHDDSNVVGVKPGPNFFNYEYAATENQLHDDPNVVGVKPGPNFFNYDYAASEKQLHDDPNVVLFFLEKDLKYGNKMNLHFIKTTSGSTLLPRQFADAIPFSSDKLAEILHEFSIDPKSEKAQAMKGTLKECEEPAMKGEDKYCATSLESMIDFSTSKLGKNVHVVSTEVEKETQKQEYRITGVKKMNGEDSVVCHSQTYAYSVFYCHATHNTGAYVVALVGADGTKAKAVAVCHKDTSAWNPKHLAFQVLKVKPGTVPVCHFLPEDHIVWASK